jgi:transcriptional regulator with XRE-family HTH domain
VKLGDVIRNRRVALGLSQIELAKLARVSQQTIAKIETGFVRKPANLPNIAKALQTTAESILQDVTEKRTAEPIAPKAATKAKRKSRSRWPFQFSYELFARLPEQERRTIESLVYSKIMEFPALRASAAKLKQLGLSPDGQEELQRDAG